MVAPSRGPLYPERLPRLLRVQPPAAIVRLVRWFWITNWELPSGQVSRQHLIAYPAFNLVIEPDLVGLYGPTTRASFRDLTGRGWAIGALLRPAAVRALVPDARQLAEQAVTLSEPGLRDAVAAAMSVGRTEVGVTQFSSWLEERVGEPSAEALMANRLAEVAEVRGILRVADLAERLGVSQRTVERLARTHLGVTPSALIRRRRIQEAAERLRERPDLDLAALAAETGYADQAHLTHDFVRVLGLTPGSYRRSRAESAHTDHPADE